MVLEFPDMQGIAGSYYSLRNRPTGTTLKGKVRNLTSFGAFVEIAPGVEGLVQVEGVREVVVAFDGTTTTGDPVDGATTPVGWSPRSSIHHSQLSTSTSPELPPQM